MHGTAPEHALHRKKDNVQMSWEKEEMLRAMWCPRISPPCAIRPHSRYRDLCSLPQKGNLGLQAGQGGRIAHVASRCSLGLVCELGTSSFPEVADIEVFDSHLNEKQK